MKRKKQYLIIYILCCILLCIFTLDALLFWIDPLGLTRAVYAKSDVHRVMIDHATGYALQSGTHVFNYYTVTIQPDYSRLVPDTNTQANCTIATIGDSVTWGLGVNDDKTWVNLLAQRFQGVQFINAARSDYSAPNVARLKDTYPAAGYIWLIITNDAIEPYAYQPMWFVNPYPPASRLYFDWVFRRPKATENREPNMQTYWQSVEQIITDNTLVFGIDDDPLSHETATRYPVTLIPRWSHNVSPVDVHPSVQGHEQIADSTMPFVEPFVSRICS